MKLAAAALGNGGRADAFGLARRIIPAAQIQTPWNAELRHDVSAGELNRLLATPLGRVMGASWTIRHVSPVIA
jgi:hypothetical protein